LSQPSVIERLYNHWTLGQNGSLPATSLNVLHALSV